MTLGMLLVLAVTFTAFGALLGHAFTKYWPSPGGE